MNLSVIENECKALPASLYSGSVSQCATRLDNSPPPGPSIREREEPAAIAARSIGEECQTVTTG